MSSEPRAERREGYERSDARVRPLVTFGIGLALLVVLAMVLTGWVLSSLERDMSARQQPDPLRELRVRPPGPVLQANPAVELAEHRRQEELVLSHYGWIDSTNGIVRIPIERAMELIAERGIAPPEDAEDGQ